ncbi:MAG: hypothetical protein L6Q99_18385 [Planctomycetes bacterium]|nr:hypothetical protein [Planctomycetota bacterium]
MTSDEDHGAWRVVAGQAELTALDASINWEDAEAVAFVGSRDSGSGRLPAEVARSGYVNWNVRVLFFVADRRGSHIELLFVDCDEVGPSLFAGFTLDGRVDRLERIEVTDSNGQRRLRCSRLAYRFLELDPLQAHGFYGVRNEPSDEGDD